MSDTKYDLVVIGGGPAGYAAAIRAGQLGRKVACVEVERAGGTCLNWGCIPSKALLRAAELRQAIAHSEDFGITCGDVSVDFAKVMGRSRDVADRMGKGIEFLFKKNKVDYFIGRGSIPAPGKVAISGGEHEGKVLETDKILVATGCRARPLPDVAFDEKRVMSSRQALAMKEMPKSIVVVGAGAIGVEFAYFLNSFGCEVTLVEMLPRIVPLEDDEISQALARSFKKQGIKIHTETKVENLKVVDDGVSMDLTSGDNATPVKADAVLVAIGVMPNIEGVFSDLLAPEQHRGYLKVNSNYETSIMGIHAAGDIIGPPWLAHVATFEAVQAVEGLFTDKQPKQVNRFPGCTYCQPQIASAGLTERAAKEKQIAYKVGKFPFSASGKAVATGHPEGFVKLIVSEEHDEILGAHIIGEGATDLITEYLVAMDCELTTAEIHGSIHPHPTLSESLMEAAAAVHGEAIHI